MKLRFIGCGSFGRFIFDILAEASLEDLEVLPPLTRSAPPSDATLTASAADSSALVLTDGSADAVYICSPDALHHTHAIAALQAGKHVLVEKPIFTDHWDTLERALAAQHGRANASGEAKAVLMLGFQRRHHPTFLAAKTYVDSAMESGVPPSRIIFTAKDPWDADQDTEGSHADRLVVMQNSLSHELDMMAWMFPEATFTIDKVTPRPNSGLFVEIKAIHKSSELFCFEGEHTAIEIHFDKGHPNYVQEVVVDSTVFNASIDCPRKGDDAVFLYKEAYAAEFKHFVGLCGVANRKEAQVLPDFSRGNALLAQALKHC